MASAVDASGDPIPTSAVLMASSKHIGTRCYQDSVAFLKCKKKDPNPEKCLEKGQQVTRCVLGFYCGNLYAVGRGKKRKRNTLYREKDLTPLEKFVNFQIPPTLKKQLVEDCEFVNHLGKVDRLLLRVEWLTFLHTSVIQSATGCYP